LNRADVAGPLTVFVYFKVPLEAGEQPVRQALARLGEAVAADGRATMSTMRRVRERSVAQSTPGTALLTWMEVHDGVPRDGLDDWLAWLGRAADEAGVTALAAGGRHVEVFESAA
jgi:hypothetical protein